MTTTAISVPRTTFRAATRQARIDLRTNLLTGTLQLHFIYLADTGKRTVQIFHFLAITGQAAALFIYLFESFYQLLQLFHIVILCFLHFWSYLLLTTNPCSRTSYRLLNGC